MSMAEPFGRRLRALRLARAYSRRELAEGAGLSESAVRDYEQARRMPSLEAAARLAVALGESLAVWEGCGLTMGAYRLPPKAAGPAILQWGQYRGRQLSEVPTGYLEWIVRDRPSSASPAELRTAERLLRARNSDTRAAEAEEREADRAAAAAAARARELERQGRQTTARELSETREALETVQAQCCELREQKERLREEVLRTRTPPPQPPPPILDDSLPWEEPAKPPPEGEEPPKK